MASKPLNLTRLANQHSRTVTALKSMGELTEVGVLDAVDAVLQAEQGKLIHSEWTGDRRKWVLEMDADVDLSHGQQVVVIPVETP